MNSEFRSLAAIVEQLASCDYQCEGGPLINNSAFLELRRMADREASPSRSEAQVAMHLATIRFHIASALEGAADRHWRGVALEMRDLENLMSAERFAVLRAEIEDFSCGESQSIGGRR